MDDWYVMYTKPWCEPQVQAVLAADNIETYFPVVAVPHRAGRPDQRAYFPCYLFAHLDIAAVGISKLNRMPGMRRVVCFAGVPARVDESAVLRIREYLSTCPLLDEHGEVLKPGDRVVITDGPFESVDAVFDRRLSAAGRVRVLIRLMQRWTALELEANALRKAKLAGRQGAVSVQRL